MTKYFFKTLALALGILGVASTSPSQASTLGNPTILPGSTQVGQPAHGSDMWTQTMTQLGLFRAHRNDCDATSEVFVEIYTDDNSVQFGFCMDKAEHSSGSQEWEDARQACLDDGKRLPEPAEFKFACQTGSGFTDLNDDGEWGSNFITTQIRVSSSTILTVAPLVGNSGCKDGALGHILNSLNTSTTASFRCVR